MKKTESQIQINSVLAFRRRWPEFTPYLFSVPNGGARTKITGARMKAEGALSGVSDLLLLWPSHPYHGLCIEFKTESGKQSPKQKQWQADIEWAGYKYIIVRSVQEFLEACQIYLLGLNETE